MALRAATTRDHGARRQRQGDRADRRDQQEHLHRATGRDGHQRVDHRRAFPSTTTARTTAGQRKVGTTVPNGTIFRILEFAPGLAARNHRTDSIDYIVVLSGEIDMELDDSVVHIKAGDVMVQRGTIHNWVNRGTQPCRARGHPHRRQAGRGRRQDAERGGVDCSAYPLMPSRRAAVPPSIATRSSSVRPGVARMWSTDVCVHGNG